MGKDYKELAAAKPFQPPPPMSMDGYLDEVTKGYLKVEKLLPTLDKLEIALKLMELRPAANEKAALLLALEKRYYAFGVTNKYRLS